MLYVRIFRASATSVCTGLSHHQSPIPKLRDGLDLHQGRDDEVENKEDHIAYWPSYTLVPFIIGRFLSVFCPSTGGHKGIQSDLLVSSISKYLGNLPISAAR